MTSKKKTASNSGAASEQDVEFEKTLWEAADGLRGSVEAAQYKHLVLGLLFLKYLSDAFEERRATLERLTRTEDSDYYTDDDAVRAEILEDRDEYVAENVFWVPASARWVAIMEASSQPDLGSRIDAALEAIERENPEQLRGALPQIYAAAPIDPTSLGQLVTTLSKLDFALGGDGAGRRDLLGRVYEYFIKMFARSEGQRGGEFYTPSSVTRLLVEMLEPYKGRVYEPCFGSAGLFVQSADFVGAHGGRLRDISLYGQENNQATWRIGRMNLVIHGLTGDLKLGNTLLDDQHKTLKADYVIANPPFNLDKWGADQVANDPRWQYGTPSDRNANYAWIQHIIGKLAPDGRAGFVLANGSLSAGGAEGKIRQAIIEDDVVDCVVALPGQLFYTTQIPVCLWFLDRNKKSAAENDRTGKVLFIDARKLGVKISRTQIELTDLELERITGTYHAWRAGSDYEDVAGFCAEASLEEITKHGYALTPGRYVGAAEIEDDGEPFEEKIPRLVALLNQQVAEGQRLDAEIARNLEELGFHGQ
jgi:type I restriction enzyme M protein